MKTESHLIFIPEVTKIFQFTSFKNWISPGIRLKEMSTYTRYNHAAYYRSPILVFLDIQLFIHNSFFIYLTS
ncbi:MAG: hypothetical protein EOP34_03060 [Rickettsiales bacterium]|nr:MAG: hypothetical protein EOP34_03060 [Rickettsiales bacterium]